MKSPKLHISIIAALWLTTAFLHVGSPFLVGDDFFCFRGWECAIRAPWKPHFKWEKEGYGDIGNMAGPPQLQTRRQQKWSVDEYGYRNPTGQWDKGVDIILLGNSFGVGAQMKDEEHFLHIMEKEMGIVGYNFSTQNLNHMLNDSRLRDKPPKALILFYVEGYLFFPNIFNINIGRSYFNPHKYKSFEEASPHYHQPWKREPLEKIIKNGVTGKSIISVLSEKVYKGSLWALGLYKLPDHIFYYHKPKNMPFYKDGRDDIFQFKHKKHLIDQSIDKMVTLEKYLKSRDIKLYVSIVPRRTSFYNDWIPQLKDYPKFEILEYFYSKVAEKNLNHIRTHDVLHAYRQENPDKLLYFEDDTHMNALAHKVLYKAMKKDLKKLVQAPQVRSKTWKKNASY